MPPKKATAASTGKSTTASHASYKDMIKDAIVNLKERNGSSRQALKKYVQNNNTLNITSQAAFDAQFNRALKAAVEKHEFTQPKGPSGPVKLAKKETKPAAKPAAKPAVKKAAAATKPAAKPATKKATTTKKPAAKAEKPKKTAASTTKKATATKTKTKANTTKQRKASTSEPAVVDIPKVFGKTKSGRVTKSSTKPAASKKAAPKKKRTSTAKGTPKKASA
ncbi:hypothetical protein FQN49_005127 [Arthroderma sp. PD_2]|nr:hypothetical protein FQN49_005127 [Arthroderma sp. PD_2]